MSKVKTNYECDLNYIERDGYEYYEDGVVLKIMPGEVHRTHLTEIEGEDYSLWSKEKRKSVWEERKKQKIQNYIERINKSIRQDDLENPRDK